MNICAIIRLTSYCPGMGEEQPSSRCLVGKRSVLLSKNRFGSAAALGLANIPLLAFSWASQVSRNSGSIPCSQHREHRRERQQCAQDGACWSLSLVYLEGHAESPYGLIRIRLYEFRSDHVLRLLFAALCTGGCESWGWG